MATKHNNSCHEKSKDDEPIFTLVGRDELAPKVVRYWAELAGQRGVPRQKVSEALACAEAMEAWPEKKLPD